MTKKAKSPLAGMDGQLMVMAAHRYCLGRRSYIVGSAVEWLRGWWHEFDPGTQAVMVRDTVEALMRGDAGDKHDELEWHTLAVWAWARMTDNQREDVRRGVAYHRRPEVLAQIELDAAETRRSKEVDA